MLDRFSVWNPKSMTFSSKSCVTHLLRLPLAVYTLYRVMGLRNLLEVNREGRDLCSIIPVAGDHLEKANKVNCYTRTLF